MAIELDPLGFNALRMCRWGPMLYNRNDIYIGRSIEKYGEYSWLEQALFAQIVRPGAIVVEAGANIGAHTIHLSQLAGADGAVFAFEPQRLVFQALCANVALNQCANVHAFQEALGDEDGTAMIPDLDPARANNFGGVSIGIEDGAMVSLRTLDSHALPDCDFLKVDVEGMEKEVLLGSAQTIAAHRPIVYVENDRKESSADLIGLLLDWKYALFWHAPPLYNPDNFAHDPENIFANIISLSILGVPAEAGTAIAGLREVRSRQDRW